MELERLRRDNERLEVDLARTKAALDMVGKAHALLGMLSESADQAPRREAEQVIEEVFTDLAPQVGIKAARQLLGRPLSSHYRRLARR